MAVSVTNRFFESKGGTRKELIAELSFTGSYPGGGEVLGANELGFVVIWAAFVSPVRVGASGAIATNWDYASGSGKLKLFTAPAAPGAGVTLTEFSGSYTGTPTCLIHAFGTGVEQSASISGGIR